MRRTPIKLALATATLAVLAAAVSFGLLTSWHSLPNGKPYSLLGVMLAQNGLLSISLLGLFVLRPRKGIERHTLQPPGTPAKAEDLAQILNAVPYAIWWKDRDGVYLGCNRAFVEAAGCRQAAEIVGRTDYQIPGLRPDAEAYRANDREVLTSNTPKRHIVEPVTRGDGHTRWADVSKLPLPDADGTPYAVLGVLEDVTERKAAEQTLLREKGFVDAILAGMPGVLFLHDESGLLVKWNARAKDVYGFTDEELRGRHFLEWVPPDQRRQVVAAAAEVMRSGYASLDADVILKDGVRAPHYISGIRLTIDDKPYLLVAGIDVSEQKRAEAALRREKALTDAIFDNLPGIIHIYDREGRLIRWNAQATRLSGFSDQELMDRQIGQALPEEERGQLPEIIERVLRGERANLEVTLLTKQGGGIPVFVAGAGVTLEGEPHILVIGIDISQRKRAEEHVHRALAQAEAANRAKDQFLAAASHELRTPLTPVLLLSSSLERDPQLPAEVRRDLAVIREHVDLEKRLIGDLLDFTAMHAGKLHIYPEPTDVHDVIRAAVPTCQEDLERKDIQLHIRLEATRHHAMGDPGRLRQVFWNLLQNACKFTADGGTITVSTRDDGGNDGTLRVEVTDTGIGIAPETLQRLFRPFEQGPRDERRQHYGGLGLGLAIAKTLVETHGGSISATSEGEGRGSTFIVRLPVTEDATSAPPPTPLPPAPIPCTRPGRLKLLLVEDHPLTLRTLARLLKGEGHEVTTAASVAAALEAAEHEQFDLVLSDIGLPDGSGLELMPILREKYGLRGIALSGFGAAGDLEASRNAGFLAHLTKPVTVEALQEALGRFTTAGIR